MKRLALILSVFLLPAAAHADGCPPSDCGTATVAVPGSPTLAVRANGRRGPADVYDLASGRRLFGLKPGTTSADGRRHFAVRATATDTVVERFDARTGRDLGETTLDRRWWLNAVSADGAFLVLAEIVKGRVRASHLAVVSGSTGRVLRTVRLRGSLQAEAVSNDGRRLFLVQWLKRGYVVRGYDFATRRLSVLRAGLDPAVMRGSAWGSVASADGRWLLTLYLEPDGETAIHALDLVRRRAACIDLPAKLWQDNQQYALVVSGNTAFAANPALGVVARVDLLRDAVAGVTRFEPFTPSTPYGAAGAMSRTRTAFAVESRVWLHDRSSGRVRGPFRAGGRVVGLGFAPDGRLRVVRADGKVVTRD